MKKVNAKCLTATQNETSDDIVKLFIIEESGDAAIRGRIALNVHNDTRGYFEQYAEYEITIKKKTFPAKQRKALEEKLIADAKAERAKLEAVYQKAKKAQQKK